LIAIGSIAAPSILGSAPARPAVSKSDAVADVDDLGEIVVEGYTTWRHDAAAAYSLIHDDVCGDFAQGSVTFGAPELEARGLTAGFAVIVGLCDDDWQTLAALAAHGHEIINHSMTHPHLQVEDVPAEVAESKRVLEEHLAGHTSSFFAFPFDEVNPGVLAAIADVGYLGARGGYGRNGVNSADFADPFRLEFDAFGPFTVYPGYPSDQAAVLDAHVDAAVAAGGWAVRECHGIADESWEPVTLESYRAHLDHVAELTVQGLVWMAPPTQVVRYRFARQWCAPPMVDGASLELPAPSQECLFWAQETRLSLVVTVSADPEGLTATQAGENLSCSKLGPSRFLVDIDPIGPPAQLVRGDDPSPKPRRAEGRR